MIEVIEQPKRLTIVSRTRPGMRLLFALLSLFPLLAPYQLLISINWQSYLHPFFALAAAISLGAVFLSAILVFAAVAGLDSTVLFDTTDCSLTCSTSAPVLRERSSTVPLDRIAEIAVAKREWSDGAPSYFLRIETSDAKVFETASTWSRQEVEAVKARIDELMALAGMGRQPPRARKT